MQFKKPSGSQTLAHLGCFVVKRERVRVFGAYDNRVIVLERPRSYVLRREDEASLGSRASRLLLLPPDGCTADRKGVLSPHPETRNAKVTILGGIDPNLKGFRPVVRGIVFRYAETPGEDEVKENLKSWKNPFYVVKDGCFGFLHNLVNVSKEWILMHLDKEFSQIKDFRTGDIATSMVSGCEEIGLLTTALLRKVSEIGNRIFYQEPELVETFISFIINLPEHLRHYPVDWTVNALNMREGGQHEPCTVSEVLNKISREIPGTVAKSLSLALKEASAPPYYVAELLGKIGGDEARKSLEEALLDGKKREYALRVISRLNRKNAN